MRPRALFAILLLATSGLAVAADTSWVERSNEHAQVMIELLAKARPAPVADAARSS